jgi:hypothetical protein
MTTKLAIDPDQAVALVPPLGMGIATLKVMAEGWPVQAMHRGNPAHDADSGWSFTSGLETAEELQDPAAVGAFDLNLIANIDPDVIPFLTWPVGTVVERSSPSGPLKVTEGPDQPPDIQLLPPVSVGLLRFSDAWQLTSPRRLLRWLSHGDMVLWRPGLTVWLAVLQGPDDVEARIRSLRKSASADATHVSHQVTPALGRLSYRLEEDGKAGLYGFLRTRTDELHLAAYFDEDEDEAEARAIWASARPAE